MNLIKFGKMNLTNTDTNGNNNKILFYILLFLLFFNLFFIVYYHLNPYRAFFNSDAAIANILAQEIVEEKSYFPKNWWYVNGDLWIFFKHTLLIPFAKIGFNGYLAHAITVVIFIFAGIGFTYFYLRKIGVDAFGVILGCVGLSVAYSPMYAREVFGENAYFWYFFAILIYLYIFLLFSDNVKADNRQDIKNIFSKNHIIKIMVLIILTAGLAAENPSRFAVYFIAPLFGALFFLKVIFNYIFKLKYKIIFIYFIVGLVLGLLLRNFILENVQMHSGASETILIPYEDLPLHIWRSFVGLAGLFGADWGTHTTLASAEGVVGFLKTFLYPAVFFIPIMAMLKNKKDLKPFEIYTIGVGYVGFLVVFGIYCVSSLHIDGLYAARENIRYVIPFVAIISLSNGIVWRFLSNKIKIFLLFMLLLGYTNVFITIIKDESNKIIRIRENVISTLLDNNLTYGYAPYWHSHVYTVLSDSKIKIRPLDNVEKISCGKWLTSSKWCDKKNGEINEIRDFNENENYFVLIPKDHMENFEKELKKGEEAGVNRAEDLNKIKNIIKIEEYNIYVFAKNPLLKEP